MRRVCRLALPTFLSRAPCCSRASNMVLMLSDAAGWRGRGRGNGDEPPLRHKAF